MTICKIILPFVTPSNNELLRMHFRERKKEKECCGWWLIAAGANDNKYKIELGERRRVTIISYRQQLCDPDNFMGGLKPLLDSMTDIDLICDDSSKYLELVAMQESKMPYRTEITIERIGDHHNKFKRRGVE